MFDEADVRSAISGMDNDFYEYDECEDGGFFIGTDGFYITLTDADSGERTTFRIDLCEVGE